jgi:hypothetical protein
MLGLGLNFGSSQSGSSAARMGGPGLLLDTYGSAAAAYSLRKLNSSYGGKVLQVRRASDHVEVDVGFDSNGLLSLDSPVTNVTEESTGITQGSSTNAAKLGEFCGEARRSGGDTSYATVDSMTEAAHVEVVTWYDQSGNTNNATQAAASSQPRIYDRTAGLTTENGKPAFTGGENKWLDLDTVLTSVGSNFSVRQNMTQSANSDTLFGAPSAYHYHAPSVANSLLSGVHALAAVRLGANYINGTAHDYTAEDSAFTTDQFLLSMIHLSATATIGSLSRDRTQDSRCWSGTWQEVLIYESRETDSRSGIESNMNAFYSIY